jgi:hypothetical protein
MILKYAQLAAALEFRATTRRSIALAGLLLLVTSSAAFGQAAQRGRISVEVRSADDGSMLPGATVEASSEQTLTTRPAITGDDGRALLPALDPATNYVVTVLSSRIEVRGEAVPVACCGEKGRVRRPSERRHPSIIDFPALRRPR